MVDKKSIIAAVNEYKSSYFAMIVAIKLIFVNDAGTDVYYEYGVAPVSSLRAESLSEKEISLTGANKSVKKFFYSDIKDFEIMSPLDSIIELAESNDRCKNLQKQLKRVHDAAG